MQETISVIVPVYNVEQYIEKCVNSILKSSYSKFELILIDDGSIDNSGKICDELSRKDSRIKVIHKSNGGLSSARNCGMDIATGEFVLFVDSDDYISEALMETCIRFFHQYDVDIIQYNYNVVTSSGKLAKKVKFCNRKKLISGQKCGIALYRKSDRDIVVNVWNKMYRKCSVENIRFVEGKNYEDNMFTSDIIRNRPDFLLIPDCLYFYLERDNSITHEGFNERKLERLYAMDYIIEKNRGTCKYIGYVKCWKISVCIQLYQEIRKSDCKQKESLLKRVKVAFDKTFKTCWKIKMSGVKYVLFYLFPNFYCDVIDLLRKGVNR